MITNSAPYAFSVHAADLNDGLDNQCSGEGGCGMADEIEGVCGFHNAGDKNEFSWTAQTGATSYKVARCTSPAVHLRLHYGNHLNDLLERRRSGTSGGLPSLPVRSLAPYVGSKGSGSSGERTGICP
jgi:hypothetical protein